MRKVCVYYNPYLNSTRLFIDGIECGSTGTRINEFIAGQPLESWLTVYVKSYRRWNGILVELVEGLNDDELEVSLYTLPKYLRIISEEIHKQASFIEEKGYDPRAWTLIEKEFYQPEKIKEKLLLFIQKEKHFLPNQHSMILMEYAEAGLNEEKDSSVKELIDVLSALKAVVDAAKDGCRSNGEGSFLVKHWEKAEKELYALYGGKHE